MRAEKQYLIDEVSGHLKKSDYVILTNFTKLTVADAAELRKRLAPEKAEFHVVKNSSFRVAAKAMGLPELDKSLSGQTAVVVGGKNAPGVAKVLKKFIEEKQKLEVKLGVLARKSCPPATSTSSPTSRPSTRCVRCSSACSPCRVPRSFASSTRRSRRSSPLLRPPNQPSNQFSGASREAKYPTARLGDTSLKRVPSGTAIPARRKYHEQHHQRPSH